MQQAQAQARVRARTWARAWAAESTNIANGLHVRVAATTGSCIERGGPQQESRCICEWQLHGFAMAASEQQPVELVLQPIRSCAGSWMPHGTTAAATIELTQELCALLSASMSHADNQLTNRSFGLEKLTKEKPKGQRKCSKSNYICNNRADSTAAENLWLKRHRNMTLALGQQRGRACAGKRARFTVP